MIVVARGASLAAAGGQDLQCHLAIESRIPGPVDLAKGAATDSLEHTQMTPLLARWGAWRHDPKVGCARARFWGLRQAAVNVGERCHDPERVEQRAVGFLDARFGRGPIHLRTVENRACDVDENSLTRGHA